MAVREPGGLGRDYHVAEEFVMQKQACGRRHRTQVKPLERRQSSRSPGGALRIVLGVGFPEMIRTCVNIREDVPFPKDGR